MKLEVLMSVMHQDGFDIAYKSKIDSDLLIINQCDKDDYSEIEVNGHKWRMISTTERGLSKSRNMALRNAQGDICLLSDDDETFEPDYASSIKDAYAQATDATAIVFNVKRVNYKMKKSYYTIEQFRIAPNYRGYSSQMLSFKLAFIKDSGIMFNEKFGSGTEWGGGEEIMFENDIRKLGGRLYECPSLISTVDYGNGSQWFHGYDEKYFYNFGAYNGYVSKGKLSYRFVLYTLYTCFYKLRKEKTLSPFAKMRWIHRGFRGIQNDVSFRKYMELHQGK